MIRPGSYDAQSICGDGGITFPARLSFSGLARSGGEVALDDYDLVFDSNFEPLEQLPVTAAGDQDLINNSQWTPKYRFTNDPRGCSFDGEWQWYVDRIGRISPFSLQGGRQMEWPPNCPEESMERSGIYPSLIHMDFSLSRRLRGFSG